MVLLWVQRSYLEACTVLNIRVDEGDGVSLQPEVFQACQRRNAGGQAPQFVPRHV